MDYTLQSNDPTNYIIAFDSPDQEMLLRESTLIDAYDTSRTPSDIKRTTIAQSLGSFPSVTLPIDVRDWESWLSEIPTSAPSRTHASRTISAQLQYVQNTTGLSDGELARAFPNEVRRETINRWRNRLNPNLRPANVYRLGLLHDLVHRASEARIDLPVWLRQPVEGGTTTPLDLICAGRVAEVRSVVDSIAEGFVDRTARMSIPAVSRDWDEFVEDDDEDDNSTWEWNEPESPTDDET